MKHTSIEQDILRQVEILSPEEQMRVLEFARSLISHRPIGTPGSMLAKFANTLDRTESETMNRAIEEACEQVEANGW